MREPTHTAGASPSCPFCKATDTSPAFHAHCLKGHRYDYYSCLYCGSIFLWPVPAGDDHAATYDKSYYGDHARKFRFPGVEAVIDMFRNARASRLARLTDRQGKVLDIGCGNGRFLYLLGRKGNYQLYGSELPGPAAERAAKYPEIRLSMTGEFHEAVESASLDAVCMFHVIEHIASPLELVSRIHDALKPGGFYYVSFPDIHSWQGRTFKGDWLHLDPPRHLVMVDPDRFAFELTEMGFTQIYRTSASMEHNPFGMIQSILNRYTIRRDLLFESFKGNQEYVKSSPAWKLALQRLFFVFSFPFSTLTDVLMGIARKGATVTFIFRKDDPVNNS